MYDLIWAYIYVELVCVCMCVCNRPGKHLEGYTTKMLTVIISERKGGILTFAFCFFSSFFYNEKEVKAKNAKATIPKW